MRRFRISDTYKLYQLHCIIPAISAADETLIPAQDILQAYNQLTFKYTTNNVAHARIIEKLIDILNNATLDSKQQKLVQVPITSSDPIAPSTIPNTHQIP